MKFWLFIILLSVSATAYAEPKAMNVKDLVQQVLAEKEVDPRLIAEAAEREEKANYSTKNPDKTEGKGFNFFGLFGGSDKNKVVEDSRKFIETEDFRKLPQSVQEKVRQELEKAQKEAKNSRDNKNPSKPYTTGQKGNAKDKATVAGRVKVIEISNEKLNMQRYLDGTQDLEDLRAELANMLAMLKSQVTSTESAVNLERTKLRSLESRARNLYNQMTGIQNSKNSLNNRYQNAQRRLAAINAEKQRRAEAARLAAEAARKAAEAAAKPSGTTSGTKKYCSASARRSVEAQPAACLLTAVAHGRTSGACESRALGSCAYLCNNGVWVKMRNDCEYD